MNTKQVRKNVRLLIVQSGGSAIATALGGGIGYLAGGDKIGVYALIGTGVAAIAITRVANGAISGVFAATAAFIFCNGLVTAILGNLPTGLLWMVLSAIFGLFSPLLFWDEVKRIEFMLKKGEKGKKY